MRPLSHAYRESEKSTTAPQILRDVQEAPPASKQDWIWRTLRPRKSYRFGWLCLLYLLLASSAMYSFLQPATAQANAELDRDRPFLLPDERIIVGTVQHVNSGGIQVDIGELEPLFLSGHAVSDKKIWPVKPGDKLKIIFSNENEPVAFHQADQPGWDIAIKGQLLKPLQDDHSWAVLQTDWGTNLPYKVTEYARHKVQNIPVEAPALFLFDRQGVIVDATYGSEQALRGTPSRWGEDRSRGNP
jgi:hypothetical protein